MRRAVIVGMVLMIGAGLAPSAQAIEVALAGPLAGIPLFGEVEMIAEAYPANEIDRVEFYVDGELVGTREAPPYRLTVSVGQSNRKHHLAVRAYDRTGAMAEDDLESGTLRIDDRIDATLQQLYVTVLDNDRRVLGLQQEDFEILDEGVTQTIQTFSHGDVPLASIILVDSSRSMRGRRLRFALQGAARFALAARPLDEVSIQLFAARLLHATPFSDDPDLLTQGLAEVTAEGGTAVSDHLYRALKLLEARQGRRVVILLSDGFDTHSVMGMAEVAWLARRSRAMIYWIRVKPNSVRELRYSAWKGPADYRRDFQILEDTVAETGGRTVDLEGIEESETAVKEILAELREQYVLGYYPTTRRADGKWHRVTVRLRRGGLKVRTRGGYIDGGVGAASPF